MLLLCIVVHCSVMEGYAQAHLTTHPSTERTSFMRVTTTVGSGLTVEHVVKELFLTELRAHRATYMVEFTSNARSNHSVSVAGPVSIIKCGNESDPDHKDQPYQIKVCTVNLYLEQSIYSISFKTL